MHSRAGATTPRQRVQQEAESRGEAAVVDACVALLGGATDVDGEFIHALGGAPARWAVLGSEGGPDYWLRVWAARALLYVWHDRAIPALEAAMGDPSWRVREMSAKVAARHRLDELASPLQVLREDPQERVVAAAERAIMRLTGTRPSDGA